MICLAQLIDYTRENICINAQYIFPHTIHQSLVSPQASTVLFLSIPSDHIRPRGVARVKIKKIYIKQIMQFVCKTWWLF